MEFDRMEKSLNKSERNKSGALQPGQGSVISELRNIVPADAVNNRIQFETLNEFNEDTYELKQKVSTMIQNHENQQS